MPANNKLPVGAYFKDPIVKDMDTVEHDTPESKVAWANVIARRYKKPSEKPHKRANRLAIRRDIATSTNASPVCASFS